jgi:hypothetical protein
VTVFQELGNLYKHFFISIGIITALDIRVRVIPFFGRWGWGKSYVNYSRDSKLTVAYHFSPEFLERCEQAVHVKPLAPPLSSVT